jgi:hypothetical protein
MDLNHILTEQEVKQIFNERTAKYLSQHNKNRHYEISYNADLTFTNTTFEDNKPIGISYGTYNLKTNDSGNCVINIRYEYVYNSPNITSPFHKDNPFYPKLSDYTIGPLYTKFLDQKLIWVPILYNHLQIEKGYKILNFYLK